MDKTPELEELAQAKNGSEDAFRALVDRYKDAVAAVCMNMLKDRNDAEEVGHKTFIRFYKSMHLFKGESRLETYITRIAINLCLNELRRKSKWNLRNRSLEAVDFQRSGATPDTDTRDMVRFAMNRLKPEDRLVITLRSIQGYSIRETSELMGIKEGTVMSKLSRATKKLKEELKKIGYSYE